MFTWISDWVSFRTMVTPHILRVVFQFAFWGLNIMNLSVWVVLLALTVIGMFMQTGMKAEAVIVALVFTVGWTLWCAFLAFSQNLSLRVSFELALLFFNMYDTLKSMETELKCISGRGIAGSKV